MSVWRVPRVLVLHLVATLFALSLWEWLHPPLTDQAQVSCQTLTPVEPSAVAATPLAVLIDRDQATIERIVHRWSRYKVVDGTEIWFEDLDYCSASSAEAVLQGYFKTCASVLERGTCLDMSDNVSGSYAIGAFETRTGTTVQIAWTSGSRFFLVEGKTRMSAAYLLTVVDHPTFLRMDVRVGA